MTKELLAVAGFSDNEKIEVIAEENKIVIKKEEKSLLAQLEEFKRQGGFYQPSEEDLAWSNVENLFAISNFGLFRLNLHVFSSKILNLAPLNLRFFHQHAQI